jgi:hypothetical protein
MLPLRDHAAVGLNVTVILQEDPAGTGAVVQLSVSEKSPVASMSLTVKLAFPELVKVTAFVALLLPTNTPLKLRLVGDSVTAGAVPVPLKATLCGLPAALSVTFTVDVRLPVWVGVNTTLIVQLALAASVGPLVFVCV